MFKGQRRIGFNTQTTLNAPVVVHRTGAAHHCSKDEVLQFLDAFVQSKESIIDTQAPGTASNGESAMLSLDTNLSSALAQLKRVQRDFKGLPPASMDLQPVAAVQATTSAAPAESTVDASGNAVTTSTTGGTKVTFDD